MTTAASGATATERGPASGEREPVSGAERVRRCRRRHRLGRRQVVAELDLLWIEAMIDAGDIALSEVDDPAAMGALVRRKVHEALTMQKK